MSLLKIAEASALIKGRGKVINLKDRDVAVFKVNGEYCAIDNICPHKGGSLGDGAFADGYVTCPWHKKKFSVVTGKCVDDVELMVRCYKIKEEGGDLYIEL